MDYQSKWDSRLRKIISDSKLFQDSSAEKKLINEYPQFYIQNMIRELWNAIDDQKRVAIYGAGAHTKKLFETIDYKRKNIVCIIDNLKPKGELAGYPMIPETELRQFHPDVIFISMKGGTDVIIPRVSKKFPECEIIDLYSTIARVDPAMATDSFYYGIYIEEYCRIAVVKEWLKKEDSKNYRALLIQLYLQIRDFSSTFIYIDRFCERNVEESDLYMALKNELIVLLEEIRSAISNNQKERADLWVFDALTVKGFDSGNMPFLKKLSKENVYCSNAYTHVPYTYMSFYSIFTEKKMYEYEFWRATTAEKEAPLQQLLEEGKTIKYYGIAGRFVKHENSAFIGGGTMSEILWSYMCDVADGENADISILHCMDTHRPHIAGEHSVFPIYQAIRAEAGEHYPDIPRIHKQDAEVLKYVDRQCETFFKMMNDWRGIICSDHGYFELKDVPDEQKMFWHQCYIHVPYIVVAKNQQGENTKLHSHLDTLKILKNMLHGEPAFLNIEEREYVEIHRDFQYNEKDLFGLQKAGSLIRGNAFKCFVFAKDKYVVFAGGHEEYYRFPDEFTNEIDNPQYAERIQEIKSKVNLQFPSWEDPKFSVARQYFHL